MITQDLELQRKDGLMIRGRLFIPGNGKKHKIWPLAIFAHGLGGNYRELEHHGAGMAESGVCAFLFDFCGGGEESISDGRTEDMTILSECLDLETVVRALKEFSCVADDRIFLMGESLGGLVAALTGTKLHTQIRGLILWYPAFGMPAKVRKAYPEMREDARENYHMPLGDAFYQAAKDIDAYEEAAGFAGPVLLIHGDKDDVVPLASSEKALDTYQDAQLIIIPGGGHGFDGDDSRHAREYSVAFIKEHTRLD